MNIFSVYVYIFLLNLFKRKPLTVAREESVRNCLQWVCKETAITEYENRACNLDKDLFRLCHYWSGLNDSIRKVMLFKSNITLSLSKYELYKDINICFLDLKMLKLKLKSMSDSIFESWLSDYCTRKKLTINHLSLIRET